MKNTKKIWIGLIGIIAAAAVLFGVYKAFGPKAEQGSKAYTLEVSDDTGEVKSYTGRTDAEYLSDLMNELATGEDFSYEGTGGDYGMFIISVNGLTADYEKDGAYWAIYVNGEYGNYGADAQPVSDGDTYRLSYEK